MKRKKHLIIPDAHVHPNYDNERFKWLGKLIVREQPDVIINLGDFADMPSLSNYDKGKRTYEGRAYQRDIDAVLKADDILLNEIVKGKNIPKMVMLLGNHENRITREVNDYPGLYGKLSLDDLRYTSCGWKVIDFLEPIEVDSINYCHYFVSGVMGRPIGGENIGKTLCLKLHQSSVQGHSHIYDHSERATVNGMKIFGLSAGCFTHPDYIEDWNKATVNMWWRGVVIIEDIDGAGYYDSIKTITLRKLKRDFQ